MEQSLNRPTLTEGESSDKPKMRVAKLRDLEEIYTCTPKCIITDVEKMSQETHASANINWHKQKSSHEDPSGKCKGKNERSLSSGKKVSKSQNSSQSGKLGASETVRSKKENNVRAAPKTTSTDKEHPRSFPHQKKEGCPATREKNHSLKVTTNKEVKTNNLLLNQNVMKETKDEEVSFRRLKMLRSSKKIGSSEKAGVEGGNDSACDLNDSDYLLIENVEVTGGCGFKRARGRLVLETSSDDEKAPDSCEKKKKSSRVLDETRVTENELNGRKKGSNILLRDHMNEAHKSTYRKDDKCSSQSSKKSTSQKSVWNKSAKSVTTPANLSGNHEATEEKDDSHVDATRNNDGKDGKLPELASHEDFRFWHKNGQKNVSFTEERTCKKRDSTRTLICVEGDKQSKIIKGKEKVSSRDERLAGKSNKTRLQKERSLRLADNRLPQRASDDHNPRFSNVLDELQCTIKRELKKPMSHSSKRFSESMTPEGTEFEAYNLKSSPSFVISQKTNPGSSKILSQIPEKTSLMANHMDVSCDHGHLLRDGSYSPLSAMYIHSSTFYPSQFLTSRHITGFKDKMQLCLKAKNSMHDIFQAKSHAAESTRTGRLRLLGKDIELDADEIGEPETSRSTGSHNITMENIFGPKPSDGDVSPMNNMARPTQSLSIGLGSRLKDSMVSQMMVHNNPATYMNSFGRSTAPLVPNNFWGSANPSYYQYQVTQQSMAAASPPTPYTPPPNGEATRNKSVPKPLNSGVPESSYLSPFARAHLVPTSSSTPRASKPAPRRCNHPSLF